MKKTWLQKWCDGTWLYAVYFLGVMMVCVLILVTFSAPRIAVSAVSLVVGFGLGETLNHTRAGFLMYRRYRDKGKKTIYGPGTVTSWCLMIPLSAAGLRWLTSHPVTGAQITGGIGIFLGIAVFLIGLPFVISIRVKSQRFAFTDKGYFEKYEKN